MLHHQPRAQPPVPALPRLPGLRALAAGQLHEIHAQAHDWAVAMAFALSRLEVGERRPILLVRAPAQASLPMDPCGAGLLALGIDPARLVMVEAGDGLGLLRAGLEGARCPGLAAALLATWGALPEYTLTASRRLVLAAETSGVPVIVLRGDAEPRASAAHSRWMIRSAVSTRQAANAPGPPALEVELLRNRGGPAGGRWRLEWDEQYECFREAGAGAATAGAPLSGAVVCLSAVRTRDHTSRTA